MKQEDIKILKSWLNGESIQEFYNGIWKDVESASDENICGIEFNTNIYRYRIKPIVNNIRFYRYYHYGNIAYHYTKNKLDESEIESSENFSGWATDWIEDVVE